MFAFIFFVLFCDTRAFNADSLQAMNLFDRIRDKTLKDRLDDFEIVDLPVVMPREAIGNDDDNNNGLIDYSFTAFGEPIDLRLKRNDRLMSPQMQIFIHDHNGIRKIDDGLMESSNNCLYTHRDGLNVGAFSLCVPEQFNGFLLYNNKTLEIVPLESSDFNADNNNKSPHMIRRVDTTSNLQQTADAIIDDAVIAETMKKRARNKPAGGYTLELAVFFDAAAYAIFAPYMRHNDAQLRDMIMAYLNGVQALYHHPSVGTPLEIVVVRLDIMKRQPTAMPHHGGERSQLLDSFCVYQNGLNAKDDRQPEHWDMAVYVSGLDFYALENGRRSGVTMGLATVGGVCLGRYACVIAELGTTNVFGKPYPSAGFTSVYILAHEIGHNLGMHHDSSGNACPKEGYIMSPSRGTNGETQWSACSAKVMATLGAAKCLLDDTPASADMDHKKFADTPGQIYTAKRQCEILLTDRDALPSASQPAAAICYNLQCKTPHRSGYYHSGPALEGTDCGNGNEQRYCFGGECVRKTPPRPLVDTVPGGWSPWQYGACTSGCTHKSKGSQEKRRTCTSPAPVHTDAGCAGSGFEVALCDDHAVCPRRTTTVDYAAFKCREFAALLPQLDANGGGLQAPHEEDRLWMGCAVFCKRANSASYYTPRIELNDMGASPYFPDGTWCHGDATGNYYCLQHHCLPEQFQFTKSFLGQLGDDIPISQNAHPDGEALPADVQRYLSLDADGRPLKTAITPDAFRSHGEHGWETDDYIELPLGLRRD